MRQILKQKEKWLTALLVALGITMLFLRQQISPYISYSLVLASPTALVEIEPSKTKEPQPTKTSTPVLFSPSPTTVLSKHAEIPAALRQAGEKAVQKDFSLVIPKIDITAPVIPNVDGGNSETYLKVLEGGVAHFDGTALPDQIGRTFIFGHSSYFRNKPGNYKFIFSKLDSLVNGDDILLWYKNELLQYKVVEKKFISPTDLSVLLPTANKTLTLQACWPIGSTKERIIINAEQM